MRRGASIDGYDVTPDGERFIMVRPADTSKPRMNVVLPLVPGTHRIRSLLHFLRLYCASASPCSAARSRSRFCLTTFPRLSRLLTAAP